jgi:hypothetical protein
MDFSGPGITYILLIIPTLFALAVMGQGIYKMSKAEPGAVVVLGFGVVFLVLIGAAYFFFIR